MANYYYRNLFKKLFEQQYPGMTWDTFLTLRGTKCIYLDYVGTLRPSKSYVWGGGVGWWPIRF